MILVKTITNSPLSIFPFLPFLGSRKQRSYSYRWGKSGYSGCSCDFCSAFVLQRPKCELQRQKNLFLSPQFPLHFWDGVKTALLWKQTPIGCPKFFKKRTNTFKNDWGLEASNGLHTKFKWWKQNKKLPSNIFWWILIFWTFVLLSCHIPGSPFGLCYCFQQVPASSNRWRGNSCINNIGISYPIW